MSQTQSTDHPNQSTSTQKNSNEESTSQYQIRPSIGKSFPTHAIRGIINEVLLQILDGTNDKNHFRLSDFGHILYIFLFKSFALGKEYAGKEVGSWCTQIVNDINRRIKDLETPQYKHIVQIMLSEQTGAGCRLVVLIEISDSVQMRIWFEIPNPVHSFQVYRSLPLGCKL